MRLIYSSFKNISLLSHFFWHIVIFFVFCQLFSYIGNHESWKILILMSVYLSVSCLFSFPKILLLNVQAKISQRFVSMLTSVTRFSVGGLFTFVDECASIYVRAWDIFATPNSPAKDFSIKTITSIMGPINLDLQFHLFTIVQELMCVTKQTWSVCAIDIMTIINTRTHSQSCATYIKPLITRL